MTITYRGIIAIVQLAVYAPSLGFALFLASRHGFGKSSGWYFLIMLTLLRIAGAICELIALSTSSRGAYIGAIVCTSIGLAPLTLLCLGLLARVNDHIKNRLPSLLFKGISLISLVGLVIGIIGANTNTASFGHNSETKASVILFSFVFVSVLIIFCILAAQISNVPAGEKRVLLAVGLSLPFIAVRLVYALIADFGHDKTFNSAFGNATLFLCMVVLEEIVVVLICISIGLTLRILPKDEPAEPSAFEVADLQDRQNKSHVQNASSEDQILYGGRPQRKQRTRRGPITMLYGLGKDYYDSRKAQPA